MGHHETFATWAVKRMEAAAKLGTDALRGFGDPPIPPVVHPSIFCAGGDFWQRIAVGTIVPAELAQHLGRQNFPSPTEQTQSSAERQGEQ